MIPRLYKDAIRISVLTAILMGTLLYAACTPSNEVRVDAGDEGRQIEIEKGQILVVSLESNPTTGYAWSISDIDQGMLRQVGEGEFQSSQKEEFVGGGGIEIYRFEALKAGRTELLLIYHRPWEKDVEPIETFTLHVVVR